MSHAQMPLLFKRPRAYQLTLASLAVPMRTFYTHDELSRKD